jgi:predicted nucleic-acid-binding protein
VVRIHLDALNRYEGTKAHFVDCLIAATAATKHVPVATFDHMRDPDGHELSFARPI